MQEIARDRVPADRLALKGGTVLNLFHLGLDRLSVDIDLNCVDALDRLLGSQGYGIRRRPDEHAGGKWLARYASALIDRDAIEGDQREFCRTLAVCLRRDRFAAKGEVDAWVEETVTLCRERFAFLFDLTANEREFLDGVLDRGEIDVGLPDVAPETRTRIENMPMLERRTGHVREHRGWMLRRTGETAP